jgi:hypothetical protein
MLQTTQAQGYRDRVRQVEEQIAIRHAELTSAQAELSLREEQVAAIIPVDSSRVDDLRRTILSSQDELNALRNQTSS